MKNFQLLIHHHAVAFQNQHNEIYLPSFIGRWVNALSNHFGQIGLLLYESDSLLSGQDELVRADNVILWSLGPSGKTWDRIPRIRRLQKACSQAALHADGLLVRGVTRRQMAVWNATHVPNKAFLLVGSLLDTKPTFRLNFWGVYKFIMWRWRIVEVKKMAMKGTLLANSPYLVGELAQLNLLADFVPTNSIRLDEFSPFCLREISYPCKILFCGRVVAEKGIIELLNSLAQLKYNQQFAFTVDIVGPVEPSFQQMCEQLIQKLGISDYVKWQGQIPYGENLFSFYRQADIFVLPTYYEGFPHAIWEAAASCCPVITTAVGGIPAMLEDKKHCLLVPPRDVDALAVAIKTLIGDNQLRTNIVTQAYRLAIGFSVDECAERLCDSLSEKWNI